MTYAISMICQTADGTKLETVYLPHEPIDADKIVRLRADMLVNGWQGRPVVLQNAGDHHIALTGVHRLAAAQGLDGVINAVYLPELTVDEQELIDHANDDDELLTALTALADARADGTLDEAVAVIRAEAESNYAQVAV